MLINNIRKEVQSKLESLKLKYELTKHTRYNGKNILMAEIRAHESLLNMLPEPRTKEEILKDFNSLGYVVHNDWDNGIILRRPSPVCNGFYHIEIYKNTRDYRKTLDTEKYNHITAHGADITREEHELISELIDCIDL